jgi:hypothetical protein
MMKAHPDLALERDANRHAAGGAQKRVLLTDQLAAKLLEIHRQDLAGIWRRKRDLMLAAPLVGEHGHEQAFTGDEPLASAEQRAHHAGPLLGAVAEHGLHLDPLGHVHHRPGLGDRALTGIELDLDELHFAADDLEVDLVGAAAGHDRRRRRRRAVGAQECRQRRHVSEPGPVRHPRREHQRASVDGPVPQARHHIVLRDGAHLVSPDRHVPLLLCHVLNLKLT